MVRAHFAFAIALGGVGCVPAGGGSGDAWSIDSATVVFTGRRSGNADIYLQRGSADPVRLTNDSTRDNYARFSPDGSRLVFQGWRSGAIDLYLMNVDGTGLTNLTNHPAYEVLPIWSPDGSRLAFMSTRGFALGGIGSFPGHIYVMATDGTGVTQLTAEPLISSLGPGDWSPDGRYVTLSREVDGSLDLFLLEVASGTETRLTSHPSDEYGAAFSRDGTRVAFHAEADGVSHLVVVRLDGSSRQEVTSGAGLRYGPRWSPDDQWLLFTVRGTGENDYDIKALRIADGHVRPIVVTSEDERDGDWVPTPRSARR